MSTQGRALVIVESPTKARTIRKYLGDNYVVEASMGHVRDLPAKPAEAPAWVKEKDWSELAVDVDGDYTPVYIVPTDKKSVVTALRKALKGADALYLATDEDREGESIGWHLLEVLKPKVPTYRMVFHEITRDAIQRALDNPRQLDERLVRAQETRRVLDRLVGYGYSPVLWRKVNRGLSAGRVQSVAVRIIVLRERERIAFVSGTWWDLKATCAMGAHDPFEAPLVSLGGKTLATGKDFDEDTGQLKEGRDVLLIDEPTAKALRERLVGNPLTVTRVERKESQRQPYPPFTTSTLQQEANRKLGLSARRTMQVAQRLYEEGHITYMRTDSTNLSDEAIAAVRTMIGRRYGDDYLSPKVRKHATKTKGAQEAHEAIRPAGTTMATAQELRLGDLEAKLYELIWKRTVSTQMANAVVALTSVRLEITDPTDGRTAEFRASGREVVFPGFFRAYVEGSDDPDAQLDDQSSPLPPLAQGDRVDARTLEALSHETRPPARYTEATIVKALESLGIGRPSTYASIIDTILKRGYVRTAGRQLSPTFTGMLVTRFLEHTLPKVVDVDFTASMEAWLDRFADGEGDPTAYLDGFYRDILLRGVAQSEETDAREVCTLATEELAPYRVRLGKYGPYVEYDVEGQEKPARLSLPEEIAPADVDLPYLQALRDRAEASEAPLGQHPETQQPVYVREGRYGTYVQLGDQVEGGDKPKRAKLLKGMTLENLTFEIALELLSLPRQLGNHPEDGEPVEARDGKYGPYVKHGKLSASLAKTDHLLEIQLARAIELLEARKLQAKKKPEALREMGAHPEDGEPVLIMDGRYGPYVKHKRTNASLKDDMQVDTITMAQAVELLAARAKAPKRRRTSKRKTA